MDLQQITAYIAMAANDLVTYQNESKLGNLKWIMSGAEGRLVFKDVTGELVWFDLCLLPDSGEVHLTKRCLDVETIDTETYFSWEGDIIHKWELSGNRLVCHRDILEQVTHVYHPKDLNNVICYRGPVPIEELGNKAFLVPYTADVQNLMRAIDVRSALSFPVKVTEVSHTKASRGINIAIKTQRNEGDRFTPSFRVVIGCSDFSDESTIPDKQHVVSTLNSIFDGLLVFESNGHIVKLDLALNATRVKGPLKLNTLA